MRAITTQQKLKIITKATVERKAMDLEALDIRGRTLVADYFVVCSGSSNVHIKAIVDNIVDKLKERGAGKPRVEGYAEAKWILIDAGDVVAHVFAIEERSFYDLESIWRGVEAARATKTQPESKQTE